MIERALIHVAGPPGAGKTALVEALLRTVDGPVICVRGERDDTLSGPCESSSARDPELRRYSRAGATGVGRFRFPAGDEGDGFFCSDVMSDYSRAIVIEGDCPIEHADLVVYVAPPLEPDTPLVARIERPERLEKAAKFESLVPELLQPGGLQRVLERASEDEVLELARLWQDSAARVLATLGRRSRTLSLTAQWSVAASHRGIENAGLVVVNVRADQDRVEADRLVEEVGRIRSDDELRTALLGRSARRQRITAVVANVADPKDPGTKKATARIKSAVARRTRRS